MVQVSAHYVRPNISRNARDRTSAFFKVLSVLAEIFVFIYIGTSISMNTEAWRDPKTWTMLVSWVSRNRVTQHQSAEPESTCARASWIAMTIQ